MLSICLLAQNVQSKQRKAGVKNKQTIQYHGQGFRHGTHVCFPKQNTNLLGDEMPNLFDSLDVLL